MSLPTTPEGWAIHLTKLVKVFHEIHGLERFPIKVASIATDYSQQVYPDEPITMVEGMAMSRNFEGMLMPHPDGNGEWGIVYNDGLSSRGRINFTLAHELGHYLLHRKLSPQGLQCSGRSMLDWRSELGQIESQANTFASYLLMPLDDFREQIQDHPVTLDLMRHLADRYEVSVTAAILKWLGFTAKRAMIVIGRDGFIDWARSSDPLLKSGIFYRARQQITPLPDQSLAARQDLSLNNECGTKHPKGVWPGNEEVHEMMIFSPEHNMSISLLIYPNDGPMRRWDMDAEEPREWDTYDQFASPASTRTPY